MGRIRFQGRQPNQSVVVGWDNPLQTYFAQVYDSNVDEDENPVLWLGAMPGREIDSVADLQLKLVESGYVTCIPLNIQDQLSREKVTASRPTPLQQTVKNMFRQFAEE